MKYGRVFVVAGILTFGGGAVRADDSWTALSADWQAMQTSMAHVSQDFEAYIKGMQKALADDEAQKETLIEWLKTAQAQATASK